MRHYEVMVIFDPDLEPSVVESFVERSLELLRSNGATPGTVERWGRRQFAYEVKHKREGFYVLIDFSAEPGAISELDRFLLLLDEVLRHKIIRLPDDAAGHAGAGSSGRAASATAN